MAGQLAKNDVLQGLDIGENEVDAVGIGALVSALQCLDIKRCFLYRRCARLADV